MSDEPLIHSRFEAQARLRPEAPALVGPDGAFSYAELEVLSRQLAQGLAETDRRAGEVVAILAERGSRVVVATLACLRAGRPFVVLDLAYPEARLKTLAGICRPGLALLAGERGAEAAAQLSLSPLEVPLHAESRPAPAAPLAAPSSDDAAYLMFTSGSTGTPKCVAVSHRPLVNFLDWQARTFELTAADRFTLLSGLSHDPVLRDVFAPLSLGASLHIPSQAALTAPGALAAWFAEVRP
ncbi:MAG TPA: AMP-binding protein, partial [Caulobacteraceae bacterium]